MSRELNHYGEISFDERDYDIDGLVRLVDSEEGVMVFMYYDEDEDRYYRNRYDVLECDRGVSHLLRRVEDYLERDEEHGLFVAFAAAREDRIWLLDGKVASKEELNLGDLELDKNMVYGMLIRKDEESCIFTQVVYHDGGEEQTSWASQIEDAGILAAGMEVFIKQFGE